jgi:hypothetical protein
MPRPYMERITTMCAYNRRKKGWLFLLIPVAIFAFGLIVMLLWNALMPDIFHLGEITYWQALGLLLLSKLLFMGKPGGGHHRHHNHNEWKEAMKNKWEHMTPEERERFKMKLKYKGGFGDWEFSTGHDEPVVPPKAE